MYLYEYIYVYLYFCIYAMHIQCTRSAKRWMIENPQSGFVKDQIEMWGIPLKDLDYFKYDMPYRKRTRIC
jgi:hypothetical protein